MCVNKIWTNNFFKCVVYVLYIYKCRKCVCWRSKQWSMDGLCHSIITDMTKKAEERASYLRPSKTQRVSEKQVAINIGVTELNKDGVANILRGKTGPLPLKISKEADILSVLALHRPFYISICISTLPTQHTTFMTIQNPPWISLHWKMSDYDKTFDSDRQYNIVYKR